MKQYITLFSEHDDYNSFKEGQNYLTPNVSVCIEEEHVHYERDYEREYLTFKAIEPTTFSFSQNNIQYSLDKGKTWTTLTAGQSTPQIGARKTIMWKQTGLVPDVSNGIGTFSSTGKYKAYGNIMSLYYGDDFYGERDLTGKPSAFRRLFQNNGSQGIVDASDLILPATILSDSCYRNFFNSAPSSVDSELLYAPKILPALVLSTNCYQTFFQKCVKLITCPKLPATTLAESCYSDMFNACRVLEYPPELPATTLAESCYYRMFRTCYNLKVVPNLPATNVAIGCYYEMFAYCSSITSVPEILPALTLQHDCYRGMFARCDSLQTASIKLPATTLAEACYHSMFSNCANLLSGPELSNETLSAHCYRFMFEACTKLNYVKMFGVTNASNATTSFITGVSSGGIFVQNINNTWLTVGTNGIPSGWTRVYYDTAEDKYYLDTNKTQECDDHGNII